MVKVQKIWPEIGNNQKAQQWPVKQPKSLWLSSFMGIIQYSGTFKRELRNGEKLLNDPPNR